MAGVEIGLRVIGEDCIALAAPVARSGYHLWPSNLHKKNRTLMGHGLSSDEAGGWYIFLPRNVISTCIANLELPDDRTYCYRQCQECHTLWMLLGGSNMLRIIPKIWKQLNADLIIFTNINFVLEFSQILPTLNCIWNLPYSHSDTIFMIA